MQADKLQKLRARTSGLKVLLFCVVALTLASLYEMSPLHDVFETRVSLPYLFRARAMIGLSPELSPKLKILTYDDSTFSSLKAPELTLARWTGLLEAIDRKGPSLIFIDQIFGLTPPAGPEVDRLDLLTRLGRLKAPVITAAFVSEHPIPLRQPLDMAQSQYRLLSYFADKRALLRSGFPPFSRRIGWTAYGPSAELSPAFSHVGHALNSGLGFAAALIQVTGNTVLPHMALFGGQGFFFDRGKLFLEGSRVPIDDQGRLLVDFASPSVYYKRAHRLLKLIEAVDQGAPIGGDVEAGDVVLILPAMFTGNTDFAETPIGPLPGGFVIASLLNSRLRHQWISTLAGWDGPLFAGIGLGVIAAFAASYWFVPVLLALVALWVAGATLLFSCLQVYCSLSAPTLAIVLTAVLVLAERYRVRERIIVLMRLLKTENDQLQEELIQAGEISRAFIPAGVPTWPDVAIGVYHQPLSRSSGDWYAFEQADSGRYLHFLMCDISGHGAQAAIIVSTCKTVLSMMVSQDRAGLEQAQFLTSYAKALNDTLCLNGGGYHTTTFLGLTFEVGTGIVHCLCAGNPRPLHFTAGDKVPAEYLGTSSTLLGILPGLRFTAGTHQLNTGDSVLAFTDGVAFPRSLRRVTSIFDSHRHLFPDSGAKYMAIEANERAQGLGRVAADDISLVWFRWLGEVVARPAA